jgi:hypothetical protein
VSWSGRGQRTAGKAIDGLHQAAVRGDGERFVRDNTVVGANSVGTPSSAADKFLIVLR